LSQWMHFIQGLLPSRALQTTAAARVSAKELSVIYACDSLPESKLIYILPFYITVRQLFLLNALGISAYN